jgi:spoIIIJ-associated protein
MTSEIVLAGTDEEKLLDEALQRLRVPREAVSYEVTTESEDSLLPGAKPQLQIHVHIRPEYIADRAVEHVHAILNILDIEAEIGTETRGDEMIFIHISSKPAASLLIGRDGQNLDALQYLLNRMILRVGREAPMVIVDVENYRRRQFEKLERLAQKAVERARETGNEIELDPMPALERKYLHHYLRTHPGISTFSRGEEPERFMVIIAD